MVSPQTAELALECMRIVHRQAQVVRGGPLPLPDKFRLAWRELMAAATGAVAVDGSGIGASDVEASPLEQISTAEAAERLGITERAVRARLASGALPGRKLGRLWVVEWRESKESAA